MSNLLQRMGIFLRSMTGERSDARIFRGYFDGIWLEGSDLVVSGWALSQQGPYDELILYLNEEKQPPGEPIIREDVGHGLPDIPNSKHCGFRFRVPLPPDSTNDMLDIRIACMSGGREADSLETGFFLDLFKKTPTPPLKLITRVDGSASPEFYLLKGAQNYRELLHLIDKHSSIERIHTMLDWGCGSGRLTGLFLKYSGIADVHGCDIDAEAVEWANEHFPQGTFTAIPLHPPTSYKDEQFDIIVSFSVLTHLDRDNQTAWLKEMRRILKHGGLFLATVHGVKAAQVLLRKEDIEKLQRDGVHDATRDTVLEGVAPDDYYRASFQTEQYIQQHWSPIFEIADIVEQGASNYHDIVVMRK